MADFSYMAKDKAGALTRGSLVAVDRDTAAKMLVDKGLVPVTVKEEKPVSINIAKYNPFKRGVPLMEKVVFARQFSTMINAGVPIGKAMGILERQTSNRKMKLIVGELAKSVEGGKPLSESLSNYPNVFSPVFVNMVKSGEVSGTLDKTMERLADQLEKDHEVVSKIKGAMIYPSVILSIMVIAFIFLMVVIIPQLKTIFDELGANLPLPTRILIGTSNFFTNYFYVVILFVIGSVVGTRALLKQPHIKLVIHQLLLRIPVFGRIIQKVNVARFARTMSSLLTSGVAVIEAIDVVKRSLGNYVFRRDLEVMIKEVKNGASVGKALKTSKVFPPLVPQMITVGEETGTLDDILAKIADFYEKDVNNVTANLSSIIEPLLMIIIGVFVGILVLGIFTPIISLSEYIQ